MSTEAIVLVGTPPPGTRRHIEALHSSTVVVRSLRRHGRQIISRAVDRLWRQDGIRATSVLVIDSCGACPFPPGPVRATLADAPVVLAALRRAHAGAFLPPIPEDPAWTIEVTGIDAVSEHMRDTWLAMVDGVIGTLGSPLVSYAPARREVLVAGVYSGTGPDSDLLRAPDWTNLDGELLPEATMRRVLDLRTGFLHHEAHSTHGPFRAVTFASRALPGVGVLRASGAGARPPRGPLVATDHQQSGTSRSARPSLRGEDGETRVVAGIPGGVAVAASQEPRGRGDGRRLDRLAAFVSRGDGPPSERDARRRLRRAQRLGIDTLVRRQRSRWSRRWEEMGIRLDGDPDLQRAVNFALFHLDASISPTARQAALGPRGLSGPSYKGHVFWDSEVFVLPFFAATRPAAARALLAYRVDRLGAAQAAAREAGLHGAWFPWESAADGRDVTPPWVPGPTSQGLRVWTGEREIHVVADIAWAVAEYLAWSGDIAFAAGDGRRLLIETARFWASRLEREADGRAHVRGVIGPDEYHELVDDNAYTNVMARWNLRAAAAAVEAAQRARQGGRRRPTADDPGPEEVADWKDVAERLFDGYDPATRLYEQFAGFHALEPIRIADLARRPAWADVLLGRERVSRAQVIKQADVLLLHHLVPGEMVAGSLQPNLDYYEPRTAHGSSLSPATHATLLARVGRYTHAIDALRMAAFFDLDDRNGTASEGLHVQTMGGLWQALVMGFGGIRPAGDGLALDPRLPPDWTLLEIPVRFRGREVRVSVQHHSMRVQSSAPVTLHLPGLPPLSAGPRGIRLREQEGRWLQDPGTG